MQGLVYRDSARSDLWLKLILGAVLVGTCLAALYFFSTGEQEAALTMLGTAAFMGLVFWAVMPRLYEVYQHGLSIVLGGPFRVDLLFNNIKQIRGVSPWSANFGVSFASSMRGVVQISLKRGMPYFISPQHSEQFIEIASQEMLRYQGSGSLRPIRKQW
jgi:hypothetical protein